MDPVAFYKCLADDTRLKTLLLIVAEGELCVCELTEALQLSQPKVSRHLALLRQSGLLWDRRQGQWVFYRLNPELPQWVAEVLRLSEENSGDFLQESLANLCRMGDRPERAGACC